MKLIVTEVKLIVTEVKATSENGSDNGSRKEVIRQFDVETLIYNFLDKYFHEVNCRKRQLFTVLYRSS